MKSILFAMVAVGAMSLTGCSVYRSGQTPDDVYYSPARETKSSEYVAANNAREDGRRYENSGGNSGYGYDDYATADDRWLMMRVRNRSRWSAFDDYGYYSPYSPYGFYNPYNSWGMGYNPGWSFGLGFGAYNPYGFGYHNHFNNYYNWNSYYNPYYYGYTPGVIVINKNNGLRNNYNRARSFNPNTYSNYNDNRRPASVNRERFNSNTRRYNNSNNSRVENSNRREYYNNSRVNDSRPTYNQPQSVDRPVRTYSPSNNAPSSSGGGNSGGSSGGSGSRPIRR